MKRLALSFAFLVFTSAPTVAAVQDFSGAWSGKFYATGADGQQMLEAVIFNFVHKGESLTGTAGPNAELQWKILNGKVKGNTLTFEVQGGDKPGAGPLLKFSATVVDGQLKGDVNAERDGEKLTAKLEASRVK